MIATNQVYNLAKPDGLTLGAIYPALYFEQLAKRPEAKFEWNKFGWIGSLASSNTLMYMRTDAPYKTIEEVRAASTPPKCGATGVTSAAFYMPKLLDDAIGTKFDIVSGYIAGSDIDLAVERGEVHAGLLRFPPISPANRLSPGARKILPVSCTRPVTNGTLG